MAEFKVVQWVFDISLTAMKRVRDNGDADASSEDEIGPMPVPDAQSVKKKRKGMSSPPRVPALCTDGG